MGPKSPFFIMKIKYLAKIYSAVGSMLFSYYLRFGFS